MEIPNLKDNSTPLQMSSISGQVDGLDEVRAMQIQLANQI
jgi:hypothetical protein